MGNIEKKPWGSRTIKVAIHFWTDQLPSAKNVDDKTAWMWGAIHLPRNKARGITADMVHFRGREDLFVKMQELLDRNGVKLVPPPTKEVKFGKLTDGGG